MTKEELQLTNLANASHDATDDVIDVPLEDFDLAQLRDGVVMVTRIINPEDIDANFQILKDVQLPEGIVPLSPILRLTPENYEFPHPVRLLVPVCCGATTAWRSTSTGWEELHDALFFQGYMLLRLTHFCDTFAGVDGKKDATIKVRAFWKQRDVRLEARWAICHVGKCHRCADTVQEYMDDPDFLEGFSECGVFSLGRKTHGSQLTIISNTCQQRDMCRLNFNNFPLIRPILEAPAFLPEGSSTLRLQVAGMKKSSKMMINKKNRLFSEQIDLDFYKQVVMLVVL